MELHPTDIRVDIYTAARVKPCVMITHVPTGTVVECNATSSVYRNSKRAMSELREKLK